MTVEALAQLIVALCALGALGMSIYTAKQIKIVHVSINSRMTELLALTQSASKAEGLKQGRDEQRSTE